MKRIVNWVVLGLFGMAMVAPLAGCNKKEETTPAPTPAANTPAANDSKTE
jgi:hypothetical protein